MHKILPKIFVFLDKYESQIFKNDNTNLGIIYRNYNSKKRHIELAKIAKACKINKKQLYVSNDLKLAFKYKAEGLYIPSFNRNKYFHNLSKTFKVIGSAHNQKEIKVKVSQNCNTIFLSPLFYVKKSKMFLGVHKFNLLAINNNKVKFLALGGILENNIYKLKLLKSIGFGGIRLFKKKPALKKAGFYKD